MNKRNIVTIAVAVVILLLSVFILIIANKGTDTVEENTVEENISTEQEQAYDTVPEIQDDIVLNDKPNIHYVEAPPEEYYTNTVTIEQGYNINDLENLEVTCLSDTFINEENASYVLVKAFTLALQAYCNDNNITEKFTSTPYDVLIGETVNIVQLKTQSESHSLLLRYDLDTDYVEVVPQ